MTTGCDWQPPDFDIRSGKFRLATINPGSTVLTQQLGRVPPSVSPAWLAPPALETMSLALEYARTLGLRPRDAALLSGGLVHFKKPAELLVTATTGPPELTPSTTATLLSLFRHFYRVSGDVETHIRTLRKQLRARSTKAGLSVPDLLANTGDTGAAVPDTGAAIPDDLAEDIIILKKSYEQIVGILDAIRCYLLTHCNIDPEASPTARRRVSDLETRQTTAVLEPTGTKLQGTESTRGATNVSHFVHEDCVPLLHEFFTVLTMQLQHIDMEARATDVEIASRKVLWTPFGTTRYIKTFNPVRTASFIARGRALPSATTRPRSSSATTSESRRTGRSP